LPPSASLAPIVPIEGSDRPGLRKLTLAKCRRLTDAGVAALALRLPHLSHLQLDSCTRLTSFAIACIARRCSELKSISFKGCELIDGRSILAVSRCCPFIERIQVARCPGIKQTVLLEAASSLHRVWMGLESSLEVLHVPARKERIGSTASTPLMAALASNHGRSNSTDRAAGALLRHKADEGGRYSESVRSSDSVDVIAGDVSDEEEDDNEDEAKEDTIRGDTKLEQVSVQTTSSTLRAPHGTGVLARYEAWVGKQGVRMGKAISGVSLHDGAKNMDRSHRKRHEGLHWTG